MAPSRSLTLTALAGLPRIEPGDDLAALIVEAARASVGEAIDGDVFVVAQKVASKAQGRYVRLDAVTPSARAAALAAEVGKDPRHVELILRESDEVVRTRPGAIIVAHRLGFVMANAGIDESNIDHAGGARVLLLPEDPDGSCASLKRALDLAFGARLAVVMNDSFGRPFRNGVCGVAIGAAGVPALRDMVGATDMFGRPLRVTEIAVADEIAAAASLLMGQADEGLPVVHVRGFSCDAPEAPAATLVRPKAQDLFR